MTLNRATNIAATNAKMNMKLAIRYKIITRLVIVKFSIDGNFVFHIIPYLVNNSILQLEPPLCFNKVYVEATTTHKKTYFHRASVTYDPIS